MASHARQQYFADGETLKKEAREFAMTDELKQKLDSIEWGAQVNVIEDVKVNGVSLEVVDKSVDVLVPLVIDNLYTVDGDNALSAKQGKILYDYIQNLQSRGRYLSNWNTATGLPSTNPSESPYEYRSGDYFVVSVTAATGGTNYRPDGSSYTIGVASTTVETEPVHITDIYLYDGTNWLLLTNSTREIPIDDALSTTSTNPVENRVVTNAINTKQDKLIAGNNIQIAQDGKTISATDTTYSAGTNVSIDANNVISAADTTYTAGANINIDANNVISATDTVYAEGTGIDITNNIISNEGVLTVNGNNGNVTVNDVKVSSTAPANPTEGVVWYDTTNDILKMYDGTNWNPVGENDSAVWGNITGTLSNQTDLQTALDNKVTKGAWNDTNFVGIQNNGEKLRLGKGEVYLSRDNDDEAARLSTTDQYANDNPNVYLSHKEQGVSGDTYYTTVYDTDSINTTNVYVEPGEEPVIVDRNYTFDTASTGIVRFEDLDTDRLKSFYLPSDVTTQESLATAQAAYEYMSVGVPILRMGSMYDTSPGTLTFFPVKKVNPGESGTMIFLSTQLSKATSGGYTMVFQDRVEFTVVDGQVTSITKQFTNSNSTLFRFLETNTNYSSTYTPSYSGSPTNKKYVDKGDTVVSATAPGTDLYEGKLWYDTTNDVLKAYDGTNWNVTGKVYTAGTGIDITNDVISCTLNPVTVSQTAPSNPESGDLWFNTTKQTLNLYNGTSWVLVGPEIVPITKAAYDLLSSADKNDGRFYLITDNDGTIYVEWANVQNAPISAGTTAPSSPNEGDIWYDTTNDILKVYDGTNWNGVGQGSGDMLYSDFNFETKTGNSITLSLASVITPSSNFTVNVPSDLKDGQEYILRVDNGATAYTMTLGNNITNPYSVDLTLTANGIDQFVFLATNGGLELQPAILTENAVNTKAFYISSESDLTTAQKIYDWYADGNLPILYWNNNNVAWKGTYVLVDGDSSSLTFCRYDVIDQSRSGVPTEIVDYYVIVSVSNGAVTGITRGAYNERVLTTNNTKTYTPTSNYNPATKKYVDDNTKAVSGVSTTQPSNPVAGSTYYDTTNNVLMVYDGTSWNAAGKTYTAGNGINISNQNVVSADTTVLATKSDLANMGSYEVVDTLPSASTADARKIYLLGPIGTGSDKYEEWIVVDNSGWQGEGQLNEIPLVLNNRSTTAYVEVGDPALSALEAMRGNTIYIGINYTTSTSSYNSTRFEFGPHGTSYYGTDYNNLPHIQTLSIGEYDGFSGGENGNVRIGTSNSAIRLVDYSMVWSSSPITYLTKEWVKIGETSIDLSNKQDKATSGSAAPSTTPTYIGQQYVDATNDLLYVATGTSSSSDWTLVGANTGVEVQVISQSDYDNLSEAEKTADVIYLITGGSGGLTVAWTNVTGKPDLIINPSGGTAGQLLAKTANGYEWTTVNSATWGNISGTLSNQTDLQSALNAKQDALVSGKGISIGDIQDYSAMQGPAPEGFHVPLISEWQGLKTIMDGLSLTTGDNWRINLHMPFTGRRLYSTAYPSSQGSAGYYWSSSTYGSDFPTNARYLLLDSSNVNANYDSYRAYGYSVRCFKNSFELPTSSWTVINGTLGSAGIFWDTVNGLISITGDGTTGYTIQDKNLGATAVYNYGDTLNQDKMGNMYQWGNNYGFSSTGTISNTSSTQVDASAYGPGNYYESDTFITGSNDWSSVQNDNLWGGETGVVTLDNAITNTGVLSVNGQTGNVTIESGGMQLAPNSPLTPTYSWYGTQSQYEALSQYYTEEEGDTVYYTIDG